jgi:hypothetical protein
MQVATEHSLWKPLAHDRFFATHLETDVSWAVLSANGERMLWSTGTCMLLRAPDSESSKSPPAASDGPLGCVVLWMVLFMQECCSVQRSQL